MEKTSEEDHRSITVSVHVPKVIETRDEIQMAPESQESPQRPGIQMLLNTHPMLYPEVGLESYVTLMSCF